MPLHINCREATRLMLLSEERALTLGERVSLGLHQQICQPCKQFKKQVRSMRHGLSLWRHYRDNTSEGGDPKP